MRLNQFLAKHTNLSRRKADEAITEGRVEINGLQAKLGDIVVPTDRVTLDRHAISTSVKTLTLIFNKPVGYVCSRMGQGSKTVYDLLPGEYHHLNPVGRLDKDSSGLLLMTNDGGLANQLTHPRFHKRKVYEIQIDKPLKHADFLAISQQGVDIGDTRPSRFELDGRLKTEDKQDAKSSVFSPHSSVWRATLVEGRNRQIRRTFEALGYRVTQLHRTHFGDYVLGSLKEGKYSIININE